MSTVGHLYRITDPEAVWLNNDNRLGLEKGELVLCLWSAGDGFWDYLRIGPDGSGDMETGQFGSYGVDSGAEDLGSALFHAKIQLRGDHA